MTAERIAIVGARECSAETEAKVREYVRGLPEGTVVISGGAQGVDSIAASEARARGFIIFEYAVGRTKEWIARCPPRTEPECWIECNGRAEVNLGRVIYRDALIFRNTLIAIRCTRMVAFVDGSRGGTWDAVRQAERFRRPCEVVR